MVTPRSHDRLRASTGVAALHLLLGWALVAGFTVSNALPASSDLKLFDVAEPTPPREEVTVSTDRVGDDAEGRAAPPNLKAKPTPVVAPPARLPVASPIPAVAEPSALLPGPDLLAGKTEVAGPGTGVGGHGVGTGSDGRGRGTGGGGIRAQRISGRLFGATDYPPVARRAGVEGTVSVRYIVGVDGWAGRCRVTRSSGNAELDATTCRLIEQRFRYRPARDAHGRPVPEQVSRTFDWLLPGRR